MEISAKQKEKIGSIIRFFVAAICGGVMITFANFTILVGLTDGAVFTILMIIIGILVGMFSEEIHYAILAGLMSIFVAFLIFYGVIVLPIILFATWELFEILVLFGIFHIVRVIMLQLVGIMLGVVVGRWIGPAWQDIKTPKHKLRIGVNGEITPESEAE
ncbi:MAG: hypothetical protein ACFFBR_08395 [Promethearchaeota archaeon]